MNDETIKSIEAWFDGELPAPECARIESLIERDPEASAYVERLQRTRAALQGAHLRPAIEAAAWKQFHLSLDGAEGENSPRLISFPRLVLAMAAVMVLGMILWLPNRNSGHREQAPGLESAVYMVETDLEDATSIVYIDQASGWTVIWVMEPEKPPQKG